MATLTGYQYALNMGAATISGVAGTISGKTATSFKITYGGGVTEEYYGQFVYGAGGQPQGTINAIVAKVNGQAAISFSGLSLSTQTLNTYALNADVQGLYSYIFSGHDVMQGSVLNDVLFGYGGNDRLFGGTGDDNLKGGAGNDYLVGGAGVDSLFGGEGADVLSGGTGLAAYGQGDWLDGGAGNDVYLFNRGDEIDSVSCLKYAPSDFDVIRFGAGIRPADVTMVRAGDGSILKLGIRGTGDSVSVWGHFAEIQTMTIGTDPLTGLPITYTGRLTAISQVEFADGTIWNMSKLDMAPWMGSTIGDYMAGCNTLSDRIYGLAGNDTIHGNGANDLLVGGKGDDTLDGGDGNDIYLFNRGDGQDFVTDGTVSATPNMDIIRFGAGILPTDVVATHSLSNHLVLSIKGSTDNITIAAYFMDDYYSVNPWTVDKICFADGTVWTAAQFSSMPLVGAASADIFTGGARSDVVYAGSGNDSLWGNGGNDFLRGDKGNDYLSGGEGDDTYVFSKGDGQDRIVNLDNSGVGTGLDVIRFGAGVLPSSVVATRVNNDLILSLTGTADKITIARHFETADDAIDKVCFADGTVWTSVQFDALPILGTAGADVILGTVRSEVIYGLAGNDSIAGLGGNDTMYGGAGNDTLSGSIGIDTLFGGDGSDSLYGWLGRDVLSGGAGQDSFIFAPDAASSPDRIVDFNVLDDTMCLSLTTFTSLGAATGVLGAGGLRVGAGATSAVTATEHLVYDSSSGALYYDADANGAGASVQIATLSAGLALTNTDFMLI